MASQLFIRAATRDDAGAIGDLAQEFADYLRGLRDPTEFGLNAETYLRDGYGANPAFSGLVAELDGRVVGCLCTTSDTTPITPRASSTLTG
jgi:hypothetical protein